MQTLSDYNEWKARQQQSGVGAANIVLGSIQEKPDEVAGDLNLANDFGKVTGGPVPPRPVVKEYRNIFQQRIDQERNKTILSSSPRLTDWLRNPENAALARDDLNGLSWMEGFGRGAKNTARRAVERLSQMGDQFMFEQTAGRARDRSLTFGELVDDEREYAIDGQGNRVPMLAGPSQYIGALSRWIDARYAEMIGADDQEAAAQFSAQVKQAQDAIIAIPKSEIARNFEQTAMVDGASLGETLTNFGRGIVRDPVGALSWSLETAGESAPQLMAGLAASVATRNPAVGMGIATSGSYLTERYVSPAEFFEEKGIDLSDPESIQGLIANPELMREAAQRGVIRGAVIGAFDALSMGVAGRSLSGNPVVEAIAQGMTQAILGSAGEYSARVAAGQDIDWNEVIAEGFAEIATTPVDMGIAGRQVYLNTRKARDAEARRQLFEELSGQAQASALRGRMPDKFREFVERATANGPVENVFVPAGDFVTYFQSNGVDPFAIIEELDGVTRDDLDAALAGGGDLKIPTATYAAKIAGGEHDAFLMENMRFDPDEFTASEAAQFNERAQEAMQEAYELAEELRQQEEELRTFEQEIYDTMVSRLRSAGRSTDIATTEAMLYPAFYRVMAERSQMTVDEFMAQYPLPRVEGERPEGLQLRDTDALNRTLAEARARREAGLDRRQTLLEFIADYGGINDVGGELRARDAETIKRGRGKKTLKLSRGRMSAVRDMFGGDGRKFGMDDVAAAAIEAGFMADNPTVIEYRAALENGDQVPDIGRALLEAIDQEIAGDPQFSANDAVDQSASEREAALDEIEEYLASIGVSLDDDDATIRAALDEEREGEGRQYGQYSGLTQTLFQKDKPQPTPGFDGTEGVTPYDIRQSDGFLAKAEAFARNEVENNPLRSLRDLSRSMYFDGAGQFIASDENLSRIINRVSRDNYNIREFETPSEAPPEIVPVQVVVDEGDYRMRHRAPDASDGSPAYDLTENGVYPDDVYSRDGARIYATGPTSEKAMKILKRLQGRPDATVTIYRAVPKGVSQINKGDWVSLTKEYAVDHGDANLGSDYDILEMKVPARDVFTNGDSLDEWGWSPAGKTYLQNIGRPRGSIQFPAGGIGKGETIVQLFQSADLSTFVHESGHYFLTVMQDLSARGEKSAVDDFAAVKSWWRDNAADVAKDGMRVMHDVMLTADDVVMAIEAGSTGNVLKDAAIDVGMQEQWARAFEAYLMEGKAPSADLRSAFEKFRAWLISIYRNLAGLNVKPSDELRQVFDRMLASDEEIAKAQAKAGGDGPLFATAEEMGLTQEEYDGFLKLRAQAEDDAKSRLLKEALAPIKREREKWFKEERAKVRDEVEREVNAYRYFRAIEWMGNRRWLGDDQPEDMPDIRMSKSILVERYGDGVLKTLPRGRQTVYAVEGGIDPDDAAGWFGFDSGDEMVKAMEAAPARKEAIEAETDRIMRERHGDVLNDGSAEVEALAAVHGDKRGQWIAAELKAVAEVAGVDVAMTAKEARASARETLSRMRVRDATAANRFLSAERKAGEEAARLGAMLAREGVWMGNARRRIATKARGAMRGDGTANAVAGQIEQANRSTGNYNDTVSRLIQAKRRQLLNHALYAESRKVIEEVEKAERYVGRLNKKSKREKIAGAGRRENASIDYLSAIDEIMERYDFRKMSGAAENRRGALDAFVEAMKAAGRENEIAIPDSVLAEAARAPYKTIAVEELRGVIDSLKNLEHVALRWNSLIDAEKQRKLDEVVADISEAFDKNISKRPPGRVGSTAEALRNTGRQFLDMVLNATTILREIDGFADFGAAYRNIKAPIDEAMNRLIVRKERAAADLDGLYSVYSKEERRRMAVREHIPELGYALSKWERIAVALNTGNEGNYARLTDRNVRGSLTEAQVSAVLASLDERDARFVQSVWDYVGSFRPDIAARERRATGIEPQWVEAKPITIAGVELKGGYYPIKYDPRLSSLARDDEAQDIAQSLQAGRFGKAQTKNGHLKERAKSSGRDVELDMSVLHRHVNQVIYDIELSEAVSNSWRILQDGRVRGAFMDAGKQADFDALETWLKDVAEGELRSADFVGRAARMLKSNFTAAKLAFNLSTVAVQLTGLPQTMVVVGKRDFVRGVRASFQPGAVSEIGQKSAFMASRQTTFNKDIYDFYSDPRTGPVASRWGDIKREIIGPVSFWLMTKVQYYLVDVPTWLAGYQQGLRRFKNDEAKAIAHADSIVKRAQASGLFSDRSAVERGSVSRTARQNDVVRLFTALGSYMFAKFNVAYERTAVAGRTVAEEGISARSAQEALSWTVDMAFLFTVEAVLYAAIKGRLPDGEDEEDEGWTAFLAKETAFSVMSTIPFVRDVGSTMGGFEGGGAYGAITKEFAAPFAQASQGEVDPALVKSIINATGLVTGAPSTQINRAVDAAWRQAQGDDVSPLEYLLGRFGK